MSVTRAAKQQAKDVDGGGGILETEATVEFLGLLRLRHAVHSEADALALVHKVKLGQYSGEVLLPGPHPAVLSPWNGRPRRLQPPPMDTAFQDVEAEWGLLNSAAGLATVNTMGLRLTLPFKVDLDVDRPATDLEEVYRSADDWTERLGSWLAYIVGGPTAFLSPNLPALRSVAAPQATLLQEALYWPSAVDGWHWGHGLDHTSTGDDPPLSHVMAITAQSAAALGDTRAAVLDAVTAVELALATWLQDRVNPQRPDVRAALLKRVQMLGPRLQLARDWGLKLPSDFQQRLVKPRNRVAHEGWSPPRYMAEMAATAARALVVDLVPLQQCCQEPDDAVEETSRRAGEWWAWRNGLRDEMP